MNVTGRCVMMMRESEWRWKKGLWSAGLTFIIANVSSRRVIPSDTFPLVSFSRLFRSVGLRNAPMGRRHTHPLILISFIFIFPSHFLRYTCPCLSLNRPFSQHWTRYLSVSMIFQTLWRLHFSIPLPYWFSFPPPFTSHPPPVHYTLLPSFTVFSATQHSTNMSGLLISRVSHG